MFDRPVKTHVQKMLEIGRKRKKLTEEETNRLARLNAGYQGELRVHQRITDEFSSQPISLYNLQMNINGSTCQIDCLLIFQHEIILLEVKNYQGDFIIEKDKWYTFTQKEIRNPPASTKTNGITSAAGGGHTKTTCKCTVISCLYPSLIFHVPGPA